MRLLHDLWTTAPRRTATVAVLVGVGAAGQAAAAALSGPVLLHRSVPVFVALAVALGVAVLAHLAVALLTAGLTADWAADIRRRLCRIALAQDLPTLEATPVGELLDRIDDDVNQVAAELRGSVIRIVQAVATGTLAAVTTFWVWWPAGVVMVVLAALLVGALAGPSRRIAPAREDEEAAWSAVAAVVEEAVHGQDDVRTSLAQPFVLGQYAHRASRALDRGRVVWRLSGQVMVIASGVVRVGLVLVVTGGAWALTAGIVDGARLTAVWLLAIAFGGTVEEVSRMVQELQFALGAWSRVQLLCGTRQEPTGGLSPEPGDLTLRGLTFAYPTAEAGRPALRDVHLSFVRGRSYAVVGRTGSGKSTLARVLTRAVEVPGGAAFLGGVDLVDLDLEQLRRWVAVVPQRTEILAGTLAENIALFDPELVDRAAGALAELGLSSWADGLPDGIDTRLGEGGHVLSAGQEQLVAFARILVRDPQVVVLDEATARLDPVTEARVHQATARLLRGRIGIVIAHRLSSVRRCDEVVVLADGEVVEAGPLAESHRFTRLLARSRVPIPTAVGAAGPRVDDGAVDLVDPDTAELALVGDDPPTRAVRGVRAGGSVQEQDGGSARQQEGRTCPSRGALPPLPVPAPARTLRETLRLATNDPRFGLVSVALFLVMMLLALDGAVLPWLWADLVDGSGAPWWPVAAMTAVLVAALPLPYYTGRWFPEWWVRQMLRIGLRLVHGQTGPRRVSTHTPAEVVAQVSDTERAVMLADNLIDQFVCVMILTSMTVVSGTVVPALFFLGAMAASAAVAALFGRVLERAARRTVAARAEFATALVSALSAVRTVKLSGATRPVLAHLSVLDSRRNELQRREISVQVWARSMPAVASGLLPIGVWALYLSGNLSAGASLVAVSTLGSARWFAWTTAALISQLPSARVWTRRTVAMCGVSAYSAPVPGVDLVAGTAPAPDAAPRHPLGRLDLVGFTAVHEDGTLGVRDVDLTVRRGDLVLVLGPVGSGKSSLLRALAGIVHHDGGLLWNGESVTEPELFLRPNQVGYVAQLPRVLSGTMADNIRLGHDVDASGAVAAAQLEHDLATTEGGLALRIGHKGTRLSGGQLQRLALARALAPRTELLVADDVSSALDVTTELELWRALRDRGVTVVGSTSKRAALVQADQVVVLRSGRVVARGPWRELEDRWGHLAG